MNRTLKTLLLLLMTPGAAVADDAMLLKCRAVDDSALRLVCYDRIVPKPTSAPASAPVPAESRFGLREQAEQAREIESHIPGRFAGWRPKTRFRLANGQVWEVSDGSSGVFDLVNPKVSIRRGALSAFFLVIEGHNRSPRVKRVE